MKDREFCTTFLSDRFPKSDFVSCRGLGIQDLWVPLPSAHKLLPSKLFFEIILSGNPKNTGINYLEEFFRSGSCFTPMQASSTVRLFCPAAKCGTELEARRAQAGQTHHAARLRWHEIILSGNPKNYRNYLSGGIFPVR